MSKRNPHLLDSLQRAGDRVLQGVVLVDDLPELGECAVLLQRVGALGLEILVHGRVPNSPINQVHLLGQVLERPTVRVTLVS